MLYIKTRSQHYDFMEYPYLKLCYTILAGTTTLINISKHVPRMSANPTFNEHFCIVNLYIKCLQKCNLLFFHSCIICTYISSVIIIQSCTQIIYKKIHSTFLCNHILKVEHGTNKVIKITFYIGFNF